MIIYNVTTKVESVIAKDWLQWMKEEHLPEVKATGCFQEAVVLRLLQADDEEGPTYTVQYKAESKILYDKYIENFAGILREKIFAKWGNKTIAYRSLMEVVN